MMALIRTINGFTPQLGENVFLAENATVLGDVVIGNDSSVWYSAVIRGDVNSIRIGNRTNVQDLAMVHCTYKTNPTVIGDDVTIGHGAVVHGCEIKNLCLIGMNAVVLDKAVVNEYCVVAAGSVVLEGQILESGFLYAGVPAKKIKPLTDAQKQLLHQSAKGYVMYADWYGED